jgi:hypothetical protein
MNSNLASHVVLVVVDVQLQGTADVVLDKLAESALAVQDALGCA